MLFVVPIIRVLKFIIQNAGHCGVGDLLLDHSVIKIAKKSETKEAAYSGDIDTRFPGVTVEYNSSEPSAKRIGCDRVSYHRKMLDVLEKNF